jgi:RecB family exonuclease
VGVEIRGYDRLKINDKLTINMSYAFDRVDIKDGVWRIVDYKTGKSYVEAKDLSDIFEGVQGSKNLMQLLIYANLLQRRAAQEGDGDVEKIRLSIYSVNDFPKGDGEKSAMMNSSELQYPDYNDEFMSRFNAMVTEIYDREKPFEPTSAPDHCKYCRIASLCGKQ